jgi:polar amino acid transport system substrate-binding protein
VIGLAALAAGGCASRKRGLSWAGDAEGGAPYVFKNPANRDEMLGFEADLAEALARELKRPIEFHQYTFDNLFNGVQRRDFDFAMNGLEITPENKGKALFSRPYYIYKLQLVARDDENRFAKLDDLSGKPGLKIGTLGGSAAERALERRGIPVARYDDQNGPFDDLALKRIDGVLLDLPIALYFAKPDFQSPHAAKRPGLKFVGEPVDEGYYAIAVNKGDYKFVQQLNAALDRLLEKGELKRIYEKWGLWNRDQERLETASVEDVATDTDSHWTFARYFGLLWEGARVTVFLTVTSMALAVLLGLLVALARLYGPPPLRWLATAYVEFFRGIPVILLLFFLYYGLPGIAAQVGLPSLGKQLGLPFGLTLSMHPMVAAVLGFGLNYAAYEAEIYRAGIGSIPAGQWEAAASLGMSRPLTFRRIILPQTLRVVLPPMTNDFVALFKDTSVVSVISVVELSKQYQILTKANVNYAEVAVVTALLYLIMSVPLGYLSRYLEKRWAEN